MKKLLVVITLVTIWGTTNFGQCIYAFYYSRSPGQSLKLNLINLASEVVQCQVRAYDAWGNRIWEARGTLKPKDSAYYSLGKVIKEADGNWGVMTVISTGRLLINVEYFIAGNLASVDTIAQELPFVEEGGIFQLGLYHLEVPEAKFFTGLIVMNPWNITVKGRLVLYDNEGKPLFQGKFELNPYESAFYNLIELVENAKAWGLAEILVEPVPIVIAGKYLYADTQRIENVVTNWRVPLGSEEQPVPKKD